MPFYANVIPSSTANNNTQYRYLVSFASRDIADQWWRAIQKAAIDDKLPGWETVKRITPQLYTHNAWKRLITESITDSRVARHLLESIYFERLYDLDLGTAGVVFPTQTITNHENDRTYTIRSQRDPRLYWTLNGDRNVVLSADDIPARFLIRLRNPLPYPNPILIGSDDIVIQVPKEKEKGGNFVSTNQWSALTLSERPDVFKFGDFKDSFERVGSNEHGTNGKPKYIHIFKHDANGGEAWELA